MPWLAVLFLVAQLGAPFDGAEVEARDAAGATIELGISVKVIGSDGPVLAHLSLPGETIEATPLVPGEAGVWDTVIEVRRADWQVVFEDVPSGRLSPPRSLTELGLDPRLLGGPPAERSVEEAGRSRPPWGWLALACAAAGTALMAVVASSRTVNPRHRRRGG